MTSLDGYDADFFDLFDDIDEDINQAELICGHKREKLFPQWLSIALSVDSLEDIAANNAEIHRDENQDYLRDGDYKAEIERLKDEFPNLLGFTPAFRKQLMWISVHSGRLDDWYEKLSADRRAKLSDPSKIRKAYEADVGGQQ